MLKNSRLDELFADAAELINAIEHQSTRVIHLYKRIEGVWVEYRINWPEGHPKSLVHGEMDSGTQAITVAEWEIYVQELRSLYKSLCVEAFKITSKEGGAQATPYEIETARGLFRAIFPQLRGMDRIDDSLLYELEQWVELSFPDAQSLAGFLRSKEDWYEVRTILGKIGGSNLPDEAAILQNLLLPVHQSSAHGITS